MSQFHCIPTLETERLVLRAPSRADFEGYAEVMASPRAAFMFGTLSRQQAWTFFASDVASWVIDGFGCWTAVDKQDGTPRVYLGFTKPNNFPELELGWMTTAQAEGKGYAFEAAKAAQGWGFEALGAETFVSYITPENTRSIALAERLGAVRDLDASRPEGETAQDTSVYRHRRAA